MTSTPSYPSVAAISNAAEVGSGNTDDVDRRTGMDTAPRVAPLASEGRNGVQPAQDHALAQRPRADVDLVHAEVAHRGLGHHRAGQYLVGPSRAHPVHLRQRVGGHVPDEAEHLMQPGP